MFYLSWLGNDPRDGTVREPSALVSELLAAAAGHHADAAKAAEALVLRHPLQPFSPQAFGDGEDPRRFSYRADWHPAAGSMAQARTPLSPWMGEDAIPALDEAGDALPLDALRRFLMDPAGSFLRHRLGLRLPEIEDAGENIEPLASPAPGLARHALQSAVFDALVADQAHDAMRAALVARGLLPAGPLGAQVLAAEIGDVAPYADAFRGARGDAQPGSRSVVVDIDGLRLQGRLPDVYPQGLIRVRIGKASGPAMIRHGLDWLLACAAGLALPLIEVMAEGDGHVVASTRPPLEPDEARAALRTLLAIRADGLRAPLPFAPYSSWLFYEAGGTARGLDAAAKKWRGGPRQWAEGDGEALRLAFRGRDPFADDAACQAFADVAYAVFGALAGIGDAEAPDVGGMSLPEHEDEEDAA